MLLVVIPLLVVMLLLVVIVGIRERAIAAGLSLQMDATLNRVTQSFRGSTVDAPPAERAAVAPFDWVQNGGFALVVVGLAAFVGVVPALTWAAPPLPASRDRTSATAFGAHQRVAT